MKHSCASVFPAPGTCTLLRSKPQQCVVADAGVPNPRQGLDQIQMDPAPEPCFFFCPQIQRGLTRCLFAVIRAKLVGQHEVDVGNDIYGNPIKHIKYDIKQIKVCGEKQVVFMLGKPDAHMDLNVLLSELPDVQGSQQGYRRHLHRALLCSLWSVSGEQQGISDHRYDCEHAARDSLRLVRPRWQLSPHLASCSSPPTGTLEKDGTVHVTLCDFIEPWESTTTTQRKSLAERYTMGCGCKVKPKGRYRTDFANV